MLIQNHSGDQTHGAAIKRLLSHCQRADLMVSYIKSSGTKFLGESLKACLGRAEGRVRILCTLEMEISHPEALKHLVELGAEVRVYDNKRGNYHPKLWIFSDEEGAQCVVGSANMSESAMSRNVEVSALLQKGGDDISSAKGIFESYWNSEHSIVATPEFLDVVIDARARRSKTIRAIQRKEWKRPPADALATLEEYIASWIQIGIGRTTSEGKGRLWRGWYIIPDQGHVDDALISRLHRICKVIGDRSLDISANSPDPRLPKILEISAEKLVGKKDKMPKRDLFVRQEKNYMVSFNLARHGTNKSGRPDKNMLRLTEAGAAFARAATVAARKAVYTKEIQSYVYNGLEIFNFVEELLGNVDYITLDEFNYFVCHAYSHREMAAMVKLMQLYRALSEEDKGSLHDAYNRLFDAHLAGTGKSVQGNYEKKVRHTLSVFGWCADMALVTEKNERGHTVDMTLKRV